MELNEWIESLKTEKPDLNVFLTRLQSFITPNGFNHAGFEKAVGLGLSQFESESNPTTRNDA